LIGCAVQPNDTVPDVLGPLLTKQAPALLAAIVRGTPNQQASAKGCGMLC
jgi:hypothetical protein